MRLPLFFEYDESCLYLQEPHQSSHQEVREKRPVFPKPSYTPRHVGVETLSFRGENLWLPLPQPPLHQQLYWVAQLELWEENSALQLPASVLSQVQLQCGLG